MARGWSDGQRRRGSLTLHGDNGQGYTAVSSSAVLSIESALNLGVSGNSLSLNVGGTLHTTANMTLNQAIAVAISGTIDVAPATTTTLTGSLTVATSSNVLTVTDGGTLVLPASNSVADLNVTGGATIAAASVAALGPGKGSILLNNGTIKLLGQIDPTSGSGGSNGLTLGSGGTINTNGFAITAANAITGGGMLTKTGFGTLILQNPGTGTAFTGGVAVNGGTLQQAYSQVSSYGAGSLNLFPAGTFNADGFADSFSSLNGNGKVSLGTGGSLTFGEIAYIAAPLSTGSFGGTILGTGSITISSGMTETFYASENLPGLTITTGSTLVLTGSAARSILTLPTPSISGTLNLTGEDLDVTTAGSLAGITALVNQAYSNGTWTGTGITSSTAATDSAHLTAIGVIQNNQSGSAIYTAGNLFDGTVPGVSDVLASYTYYGDANLDGKVDGSDYTRIDNGYLTHTTGWFNGDFNYDGIVDGSDYTLIDNAFNTQGAQLTDEVASATSQIAGTGTSPVPEPSTPWMLGLGAALLGRRRWVLNAGRTANA